MTPIFKHTLISSAVFSALMLSMPMLQAQTNNDAIIQVNIPSGNLVDALNKFAAKQGISLQFSPTLTQGLQTSGLNEEVSIEQGFLKLLKGTNLTAVAKGDGVYILQMVMKKATASLPHKNEKVMTLATTSVSGNNSNETTEGSSSYTTEQMRTATKLDLSIRETPQSVMVISNQYIADRNIDDFETLMKNVTGISSNSTSDPRITYNSRGFAIDYYLIDGMPSPQLSSDALSNYNMDIFDRVEIVKGANGLMSGAGNPAASINMIRKHANSEELTADIDASIGAWGTYKLKADASTALNQDGTIRGRVVVSHKETDTFKDRYHQENDLFYAVVDADITDSTTLSAGASYALEDRDGAITDFPAFNTDGTPTNFSRSKNYSPDWLSWDTETTSYFSELKHEFDNGISLNAVYSHSEIETKDRLSGWTDTRRNLSEDGSGIGLGWVHLPQDIKEDNVDVYTSIPFELGNQNHEIIAGFQYSKQQTKKVKKGEGSLSIDNFFTSDGSEHLEPTDVDSLWIPKAETETLQTSLYLTGKFELSNDLKLILGSRLTNWEFDYGDQDINQYYKYENKNEITPFAGLVYDIDTHHSVYVSYTDIFKPQNYKDENEKLLDPVVGNNYEIGIKGEYFDGTLNAGLTLFRIEQSNVAQLVDGITLSDGSSAYRGASGVTSEGFELEVGGQITDNWDINVGFSNFEATEDTGDKISTTTPRNNLNIFTKYTINNFSVGGGVNWKSKTYSTRGDVKNSQDDYALVDIMASYRFNESLSAQLNINNLFDKKYNAGYNTYSYNYGTPLDGSITVKYIY